MADPTDEQLRAIAEGRVPVTIGCPPTYVFTGPTRAEIDPRALAAELLRLREVQRAADELADEIERHNDDIGLQALGYVTRYRVARGER